MGDEARRAPRRRHQRPQGARRSGAADGPHSGCYSPLALGAVRFPFTFMGVLSLALGVWIFVFFLIRKPDGPVSGGIEIAMAFVMVAFGSWVVWRRLTKGTDA